MKLVIIESPYAGDVARNETYARRAMMDCLDRGEAPYASHLLYTQPGVLDDDDPDERALGIAAGFAWREVAHCTVVYQDYGISPGMAAGIRAGALLQRGIEYRSIGKNLTLTIESDIKAVCADPNVAEAVMRAMMAQRKGSK